MNKSSRKKGLTSFTIILELIAFLISLISALIISMPLNNKIRYSSEYEDKMSFYEDSNFDLTIGGASNVQIIEFENNKLVDKVTPVQKVNFYVKNGSLEDYRNVISYNNENDLEYTEFTEKRIISKLNDEPTNKVYIDYKYSCLYDVDLGDKLIIMANESPKEFIVSRVYRTDYIYSDGVVVANKNVLPTFNSTSYYLYIKSSNVPEFKNSLNTYKPMGTLLPQIESQTDEEYKKYLDEFNSKNYSEFILSLANDYNQDKENYQMKIEKNNMSYIISVSVVSVIALFTSLICFFINAKNKSDRIYKYIQENGKDKILKLYSIFNLTFIIFSVVAIIAATVICANGLSSYISLSNAIGNAMLALVVLAASILLGYVITLIKIKKA